MKKTFRRLIVRTLSWFSALSLRERRLVGAAGAAVLVGLLVLGVPELTDAFSKYQHRIEARRNQLSELVAQLKRYKALSVRMKGVEESYSHSEMTVDQVYTELDRIVRDAIGADNYDLKKSQTTTAVGPNSEEQAFTLRIRSLSIEQLVKLLYQLEHGKAALFLGKVDIIKNTQPGTFSATLEVSSVRRKKG